MSRSSLSGSSTCRSARPSSVRWRARSRWPARSSLATSVRALDAERAISQYLRDRWGSESGFPGGPVYAIAQTSDGYLWIGAEKGLVRFDGLTFRLIDAGSGARRRAGGARRGRRRGRQPVGAPPRHRPRPLIARAVSTTCSADQGAPRSVVTAMARGRDGVMLLATLAHGAMAYRGGRFDPVTVPGELPARPSSSRSRRPRTARSGSAAATPASSGSAGRRSVAMPTACPT